MTLAIGQRYKEHRQMNVLLNLKKKREETKKICILSILNISHCIKVTLYQL